MKTMPILIAMLLVGSVFGESIYTPMTPEEARREAEKGPKFAPSTPDMTHINDEACKPMKVDYSLITFPDGKTASVLTFK